MIVDPVLIFEILDRILEIEKGGCGFNGLRVWR